MAARTTRKVPSPRPSVDASPRRKASTSAGKGPAPDDLVIELGHRGGGGVDPEREACVGELERGCDEHGDSEEHLVGHPRRAGESDARRAPRPQVELELASVGLTERDPGDVEEQVGVDQPDRGGQLAGQLVGRVQRVEEVLHGRLTHDDGGVPSIRIHRPSPRLIDVRDTWPLRRFAFPAGWAGIEPPRSGGRRSGASEHLVLQCSYAKLRNVSFARPTH